MQDRADVCTFKHLHPHSNSLLPVVKPIKQVPLLCYILETSPQRAWYAAKWKASSWPDWKKLPIAFISLSICRVARVPCALIAFHLDPLFIREISAVSRFMHCQWCLLNCFQIIHASIPLVFQRTLLSMASG
jgi:hypothetical protein